MQSGIAALEKVWQGIFLKYKLTIWLIGPTHWYPPNRNENLHSHTCTHAWKPNKNVYASFFIIPRLETTRVSFSRWINCGTHTPWNAHQSALTRNQLLMDATGCWMANVATEWRKPDSKGYIRNGSIFTSLKKVKWRWRKDSGYQRLPGVFDNKETDHGISGVMELFCTLIEGVVSRTIPVLKL